MPAAVYFLFYTANFQWPLYTVMFVVRDNRMAHLLDFFRGIVHGNRQPRRLQNRQIIRRITNGVTCSSGICNSLHSLHRPLPLSTPMGVSSSDVRSENAAVTSSCSSCCSDCTRAAVSG